jgi:hypothetical protein
MSNALEERIAGTRKTLSITVFMSLCTEERLKVMADYVLQCRHIPGEFWEMGVYQGGSAGLIGKLGEEKTLRLFDSFQGVSEPGPEDQPTAEDLNEPAMWAGEWRGDVKRAALNIGREAIFHVGWIPETFAQVPQDAKVSFAHVDVDLYRPTKDSLQFILPRLSEGGIIVVDDFDIPRNPGVRKAVEELLPAWPGLKGKQEVYGQVVLWLEKQ